MVDQQSDPCLAAPVEIDNLVRTGILLGLSGQDQQRLDNLCQFAIATLYDCQYALVFGYGSLASKGNIHSSLRSCQWRTKLVRGITSKSCLSARSAILAEQSTSFPASSRNVHRTADESVLSPSVTWRSSGSHSTSAG